MTLHAVVEFATMLAGPTPSSGPSAESAQGRASLTPRETELLALVAQGHTDARIAEMMFISIRTVRSHLDRIRDKTGRRRRADLTRLALQRDLL
jgi:DNA-binding CsgD family transcriptional regulator